MEYFKLAEQIDAVSAEDIIRVCKKMLSYKPTVVSYGHLAEIPFYDQLLPTPSVHHL